MLRFLFRNPSRRPTGISGIFVPTAGLASVFDDVIRIRARFSFPIVSPSSLLPLFLNQQWSSKGPGLSLVNFSVASPVAPDASEKGGTDQVEDNSDCIRGCLGQNAIARAADKADPAVVSISVVNSFHGRLFSHITRLFVGENVQAGIIIDPAGSVIIKRSLGSGAIIDPDGTILTCAHVVVDPDKPTLLSKWMAYVVARKRFDGIEVKLQDGREYVGNVINVDRHLDIAIVKIKSKTPFPYLKVGNSRRLRSGDWVVAVGCPLKLQNTFTVGIISQVDRKGVFKGILQENLQTILQEYLQTNCALHKGMLGGPLVNLDGEIVGINVMVAQNSYRLSFAVPIESALKIIEHFKKHGRVIRPWLGLEMRDIKIMRQLTESFASFDVSKDVQVIVVKMVTPRSPGDHAGFCEGDVIIEFDGKPVSTINEMLEILGDRVGVKIEARVLRANNKKVSLTVIPEEAIIDRR